MYMRTERPPAGSALRKMHEAVGPWYRGKRVSDFTNEELIEAINNARKEGIEVFINECMDQINFAWSKPEIGEMFETYFGLCPMNIEAAAVRTLEAHSPEGWGDAAARKNDEEYHLLWDEALARDICENAHVDGGWEDG